MTGPGARPKFRIDPTAPEVTRPAPPLAPSTPTLPSPAPLPASAPPSSTSPARKRWVVWAVIGVAVVLAGTAVAVFVFGVGGLVYPQKYLVASSEVPHGVRMSDPQFASQDLPCETNTNPCKLTRDGLDTYSGFLPARPKEAWAEGLDTPQSDGAPIAIAALKFSSTSDADASISRLRLAACNTNRQAGGALLQDGDVVVLVTARDAEAKIYEQLVLNVLRGKASGLRTICSV